MTPRSRFVTTFVLALSACAHKFPAPPAEAPHQVAPSTAAAATGRGYDADLTAYAYPFAVQLRTFESQQQTLRMAYMDVAPSQPNGRTVLLLHGKNFSGAYWEQTIRALAERGYRVVVPDQVGFGKSSKPRAYQFTFHALAEHTRALLDELHVTKAAVVGHSMGGMLATRFALLFPERVERLSLVNPIGLEDWSHYVPYTAVDATYQRERENSRDKIREYMRQSYFAGTWKEEYEPLIEMLAGWSEGPDRELIAWVSALTTDMVFTQPVVHEFPRLALPTQLIIGTRDRTAIGKAAVSKEVAAKLGNYEQLGKSAAAAIPGASLVELPGVGHMPQVEAFEPYIAALTKFLAP
jgi:pimeloyl-ACP methyl ester carboxylesterase